MDSSADDALNLFDMSGRQRPGSYSMAAFPPRRASSRPRFCLWIVLWVFS